AFVLTSAATGVIVRPVASVSSCAVAASTAASRPLMTTSQPASARARAQPFPRPRLDAQTMALRPAIPRSMRGLRYWTREGCRALGAGLHDESAAYRHRAPTSCQANVLPALKGLSQPCFARTGSSAAHGTPGRETGWIGSGEKCKLLLGLKRIEGGEGSRAWIQGAQRNPARYWISGGRPDYVGRPLRSRRALLPAMLHEDDVI